MFNRELFFYRSLAFVYFLAFSALIFQIQGLIGPKGIIPCGQSNELLIGLCFAGAILSLVLLFDSNFRTRPFLLAALFLAYLLLVNWGSVFLSFQWDVLLLETGFLTLLYSLFPLNIFARKIFRWLFIFLIFKLMLMSGLVKLASGDQAWRDLSALKYHYFTQPIPNFLAYYMHQMPAWFHQVSCAVMILIELVLPFFIFLGSKFRSFVAWSFIGLMLVVIITGNYCFFNLLTIALCFWLFKDKSDIVQENRYLKWSNLLVVLIACFYTVTNLSFILIRSPLKNNSIKTKVLAINRSINKHIQKFHIVNPYGLFAVMTKQRYEIIIQGSNDAKTWLDYEFHWKPQKLNEAPKQVAPYHPRLDWQIWFAALRPDYRYVVWFKNLMLRLLKPNKELNKLFSKNPFPNGPKYIRAVKYDYKFTSLNDHAKSYEYWTRKGPEIFMPILSFKN